MVSKVTSVVLSIIIAISVVSMQAGAINIDKYISQSSATTSSVKVDIGSGGSILRAEITSTLIIPEALGEEAVAIISECKGSKSIMPIQLIISDGVLTYTIKNQIIGDAPDYVTITHTIRCRTGEDVVLHNKANIKDTYNKLKASAKSISADEIQYNPNTETLSIPINDASNTSLGGTVGIAYKYTKLNFNQHDSDKHDSDKGVEQDNPIYFTHRDFVDNSDKDAQISLSLPLIADKLYYSVYYSTDMGKVFSEVRARDILDMYEEYTMCKEDNS